MFTDIHNSPHREDIELAVDESKRRLTVSGSIKSSYHTPEQEHGDKAKKDNGEKKKSTPHVLVSERVFGSFQRSFTLPQTADVSKTTAKVSCPLRRGLPS